MVMENFTTCIQVGLNLWILNLYGSWVSKLKEIAKIEDVPFSYSSPCEKCPTMFSAGKGMRTEDLESDEILSWPFGARMGYRFTCAWRKEGFCYANAKTLYYGERKCLEREN